MPAHSTPSNSRPRLLLTPARCKVLAAISRRGPSTSAELADEFGARSKAALTRCLRTLVAGGLLEAEQIEPGYGERRYSLTADRYSLTAEANRIGYRDRSSR